MRGYLFVTGCGRSGTTLLSKLLGAHPNIVLGSERYMRLQKRKFDEFTPALFEKERFFDFRADDSGHFSKGFAGSAFYDSQFEKWAGAIYRGDKITTLFEKFDEVAERFANVKFVHVIRDPLEVALSWRVRVEKGTLPKSFGTIHCMTVWNQANQSALEFYHTNPNQIILVEYERILATGQVEKLLERIDSELGYPDALKHHVDELIQQFEEVSRIKEKSVSGWRRLWIKVLVKMFANQKAYEKLKLITI